MSADHDDMQIVAAHLPGYARPEKTQDDHIPDIVATKAGAGTLFAETETCETLEDEASAEQWRDFFRSADRFELSVPSECEAEAVELLEEAGVGARVFGL